MRNTYLGCHELGSSTESASSRAIPHVFLAQTVISNPDVTVKSQHDIVKLQVAVDDTVLVKVFERQADFSGVESVDC